MAAANDASALPADFFDPQCAPDSAAADSCESSAGHEPSGPSAAPPSRKRSRSEEPPPPEPKEAAEANQAALLDLLAVAEGVSEEALGAPQGAANEPPTARRAEALMEHGHPSATGAALEAQHETVQLGEHYAVAHEGVNATISGLSSTASGDDEGSDEDSSARYAERLVRVARRAVGQRDLAASGRSGHAAAESLLQHSLSRQRIDREEREAKETSLLDDTSPWD